VTERRIAREIAERRGRRAETLAALWLTLKGYRIVARNLKTPPSEVDIVAVRGRMLVAVEVKQRANFEACEESLNWATRRRLDRAAEWLLDHSPYGGNRDVRIDAVLIVGWQIRHVKAAWRRGE